MKKKSSKKGLASYDKVIEEHKRKVKNEKEKQSPKLDLIDYWEKEIKSLEKNREKLAEKM